jgi:hypothetical protein
MVGGTVRLGKFGIHSRSLFYTVTQSAERNIVTRMKGRIPELDGIRGIAQDRINKEAMKPFMGLK